MKNLKYVHLFEAFESQRLSKTLKFIDKSYREMFMSDINMIAKRFDFPISRFNDDMFEYLPFKSALKKNVPLKDDKREVCNRESDWIPGEFCHGGRVKRTWGSHTRMTECPGCNGTGFKPYILKNHDVSLVKFWFDKDGNCVNVTGCDGQIRPQNTTGEEVLYNFSKDLNDYNQVGSISLSSLLKLPTGSIVWFSPKEHRHPAVCMVLNGKRHGLVAAYMLQNEFSGSTPDNSDFTLNELKRIANYSWCVMSPNDFWSCIMLEPKVKKSQKDIKSLVDEEAYTWNNLIDLNYMELRNRKDMESQLKNAHFAIILDLNKLKESEFKKISSTRSERKLRKYGAFLKPEEVKNANIERYLGILIKKFDVNKGLSELTKVLPRAFGYTNMLTFTLRTINFDNMYDLINVLYSYMSIPSESNERSVIYRLNNIYEISRKRSEIINATNDKVWKLLDEEKDERYKKYFQSYCDISEFLYKKVKDEKIETLTDIETLIIKLSSIRQFLKSTRFDTLRRMTRYIAEYLSSEYPPYVVQYIKEAIDDYPNAQSEIEELKKMIEKTI